MSGLALELHFYKIATTFSRTERETLIAAEKKLISFSELGQVHNPNKCVIPGITQRLTANEESGELRGVVLNFIFSVIAAYEPF